MKKLSCFLLCIATVLCFAAALTFSTYAADLDAPEPSVFSVSNDEITLMWAAVDGADGYKIYMSESADGKFNALGVTKNTYYTADNLDGGTEYYFAVRPFIKGDGTTRDFGTTSEHIAAKTLIDSVENIVCKSADSNSISFSWGSVTGAEKYIIKIAEPGSKQYKIIGETSKTDFRVEGLLENSAYKIRISAGNEEYTTPFCTAVKLYTMPSRAEKPKLKSVENGRIKLTWKETNGADYYNIYLSDSKNGTYKKIGKSETASYTCKANVASEISFIKIAAVKATAYQTTEGKKSAALKVDKIDFKIKVPAVIRNREYPDITVPGYDSKVKWTSSDKSVIKVQGGRLYACGQGTATITAKYNGYSDKVKIKVGAPVLKYMSCVFDVTNNRYVFASRINERCYPASITKLITALVALKYMNLNDTIVVGSELNMVEPLSSRCGIQKGEKFRLGDILYGLLLPSGGDAAYTIAVNCARKVSGNPNMGYVEAKNYFVSLMNSYMKSIGATGTHLVNPHGYPVNGHYTTVHDLCLVARNVLKNKTLKSITSTPTKYIVAKTGKGRTWTTTNSLIKNGSSFYSPYAHGMKTGTVDDYYTGIVSAATKNGRTIITVAVGCESYNARYIATRTLYNYYL